MNDCEPRERNSLLASARLGVQIAEREMERATENLSKAHERLRQAEALPKEPKPGSVIKFYVQPPGDICLTYVATRTLHHGGYWVIAGDAASYTWAQMVRKMMSDEMNQREGTVSFYDFEKQKWQGRKP